MKENFIHDPEKYAAMSAPFPREEDGAAALDMFFKKIVELRESYRIAEVVVVAQVYTESDDPKFKRAQRGYFSLGDLKESFRLSDITSQNLAMTLSRAITERHDIPNESQTTEAEDKG